MLSLDAKIESYLFYTGEDVAFADLAKIFDVNESEVISSVDDLRSNLENRGLTLITTESHVSLRTSKSMHDFFVSLVKKDENSKLTQASAEVLSLIAYLGKVTRGEIDFIRGVNSTYSIRTLISRLLIDRNEKNQYFLTTDAMSYLGLEKKEDLPDFENVNKKFKNFITVEKNEKNS